MKTKNKEQITRKDALKKMGTYAAFTALGTMVLLSPKASQAGSTSPTPPKRETPPPSAPKKED
jgi:hypothetical protein